MPITIKLKTKMFKIQLPTLNDLSEFTINEIYTEVYTKHIIF